MFDSLYFLWIHVHCWCWIFIVFLSMKIINFFVFYLQDRYYLLMHRWTLLNKKTKVFLYIWLQPIAFLFFNCFCNVHSFLNMLPSNKKLCFNPKDNIYEIAKSQKNCNQFLLKAVERVFVMREKIKKKLFRDIIALNYQTNK